MKHKWYDEIVAWAGGAEIEMRVANINGWKDAGKVIDWDNYCEYRIKPQPKEPNYLAAFVSTSGSIYLAEMKEGTQLINGYLGKIEVQDD